MQTPNNIDPDHQQTMNMLVKAYKMAYFHFGPDQQFSFSIDIPDLAIKSATWKMGKSANTILVLENPSGNIHPGCLWKSL